MDTRQDQSCLQGKAGQKRIFVFALILSLAISLFPSFALAIETTKTNFLAGSYHSNLINDSSFIDVNSMTATDIQNFLTEKKSALAAVPSGQLGEGANGRSAAQIIYDAAHGLYAAAAGDWNGISISSTTGTVSPKIILTYLEKEQSLVSSQNPSQNSLDCAMGYDIDGSGCQSMFVNHPSLRGFSNQVGNGAWQLRYDYEYALRGTKPAGFATHYVVDESLKFYGEDKYNNSGSQYYNPAYFGPFDVTMNNAATAAIYSYTPYVFDSAYNFWKIFNDWFTATPEAAPAPVPNDTAEYNLITYTDSITVGGTKSSESRVYYNNQLIQDAGQTRWQLTFTAEVGRTSATIEYRNTEGSAVAAKAISVERHKPADINGDSSVNIQDLSILAAHWGVSRPGVVLTDLNGDGIVDILDLSVFAGNWNG